MTTEYLHPLVEYATKDHFCSYGVLPGFRLIRRSVTNADQALHVSSIFSMSRQGHVDLVLLRKALIALRIFIETDPYYDHTPTQLVQLAERIYFTEDHDAYAVRDGLGALVDLNRAFTPCVGWRMVIDRYIQILDDIEEYAFGLKVAQ